MKQDKYSHTYLLIYALGLIPVVWIALLIAPYMDGGIPGLIANMNQALANPFRFQWGEDTPRTIVILCILYMLAIGIFLSDDRNYRRREEYGSAKWGLPSRINAKYAITEIKNILISTNALIIPFCKSYPPSKQKK